MRKRLKKKIETAELKTSKKANRGFFLTILTQSLLAVIWLLMIPKEPSNAEFLGYSYKRLLLLLPLLLPSIGVLLIKEKLFKSKTWQKWFELKRNKAKVARTLIFGGLFLTIIVWSFIFFNYFLELFKDAGKFDRLMPIFILYLTIGIEFLVFVVTNLYTVKRNKQKPFCFPWKSFLVTLLIIGFIFLVINLTGWGQGATRIVIVSLGVPVLEGQIWYVIGMLLLFSLAAVAWNAIPSNCRSSSQKHLDTILFLTLWLIAVLLWASLPLPEHNYFAPSSRPPNYEKYPFSDAEQYDYNSLYVLYGTAENFVVSKPLYVSFLVILHAIVGLDYAKVVFIQTLVIALFPGVLYLIGKELHSRLGGIAIAFLVIFREINSIQASTMANVSNSKLYLSGMLAALIISLMVFTIIRWFKNSKEKASIHVFTLGGLIGALILTRIQAVVLVPFGIILVIVRYFKNLKTIFLSLLLFLLAIGLILSPALIRNHSITGVYWVDNPSSSGGLYRYFIVEDDYGIEIPEAETMGEELKRNISVITAAFTHGFGGIVQFIMDHFMRNEISSMLILPVRLGNTVQFIDLLRISEPFWSETYTMNNSLNLMVFAINSSIIALGFSNAINRNRWMALSIIGLHLVYSLSSAIVRIAGWRFILPVDWIILLFYSLGLVEIVSVFFQTAFGWNLKVLVPQWAEFSEDRVNNHYTWKKLLFFSLILILVGGFIPLREILFSSSAPRNNKEEVCRAFISEAELSRTPEKVNELTEYCMDESTVAYSGVGVYPRLFNDGEGYYDRSGDPRFGEQDFSRLVFRSIGIPNWSGYIKTNRKEIIFPNGALVYVLDQDLNNNGADYVLVAGDGMDLITSETILKSLEKFEK
jgi:hypothetical protein